MGVRTTADEKVDEARQSVKEAAKALSSVVIEECYGHDEFRDEFRETLHEVLMELVAINKKLNP